MTQKRIAYYLPDRAEPGEVLEIYLRITPAPAWRGYLKFCKTNNRRPVHFSHFAGALVLKKANQ